MRFFLGLILISFVATSAAIVPFINLLYRLKFTRRPQKTRDFLGKRTQIFDRFHHYPDDSEHYFRHLRYEH